MCLLEMQQSPRGKNVVKIAKAENVSLWSLWVFYFRCKVSLFVFIRPQIRDEDFSFVLTNLLWTRRSRNHKSKTIHRRVRALLFCKKYRFIVHRLVGLESKIDRESLSKFNGKKMRINFLRRVPV